MKEPRAYRYSPDCPKGRIFTGADAIAAADADGWVDSPAKVKSKPESTPTPKPAAAKKKAKKRQRQKRKAGGAKVATSDNSP